MIIINAAGVLCYFIGVKITFIVTGTILGIYFIYLVIVCVKFAASIKTSVENSFPTSNLDVVEGNYQNHNSIEV